MLSSLVLFSAISCTLAAPSVPSLASSFAGATSSAIFPPPDITIAEYASFFPDASQVGFPGPTPTGVEAAAIATAPAAAWNLDAYPLVAPTSQYVTGGPAFNPMYHWGNLGPWYSVGDAFGLPDTSPQIPEGCELQQVHLLFRHGARYPTSGSSPSQFAAKVHGAATTAQSFTASGPLEFLNTWTYKLGAEILTPFGRAQPFNLGMAFRVRYGQLLNGFADLPVFRTTSEDRMQKSLTNFAAGFFGVPDYQTAYHEEIIIENSGYNNTLAPFGDCANANNEINAIGGYAEGNWTEIYLKDTVTRLNQYLEGLDLEASDVYAMQEVCAYETVALGYSDFCGLFTEEEWKGFEYSIDLDFWYANGPGNPAAAAQGIGYVTELVARLTGVQPTESNSVVNITLDKNPITFPLNQPIYVDASHDTVISTIITALNFTTLAANGPLPIDHIPVGQTYHVQEIAPFSTNLVGQVMSCPVTPESEFTDTFIRFLLNDGAVPLTGIAHCETPNKDGLCLLADFIQGMQERIAEVNFEVDCFGNYSVPVPDTLIDGRYSR